MTLVRTAPCRDAIEALLLDTNILIYAYQPGGDWLSPSATHADAAIASVNRIEALSFPDISSEEEMGASQFHLSSPSYPLDHGLIELAIRLRQQRKMKPGDAIIAATALEYEIPSRHLERGRLPAQLRPRFKEPIHDHFIRLKSQTLGHKFSPFHLCNT